MEWVEIIKRLIALFAIVDPVGAVIFFLALTKTQTAAERARTAAVAPAAMAGILAVAALGGEQVLWFFGISIHSFKVGGGLLILFTAIAMLWGYAPWVRRTAEEDRESREREDVAVVPLGIPLLAGPGAVTAVIIAAQENPGVAGLSVEIGIIFAVALITFAIFHVADLVAEALGTIGMNIFTRLLGLLLAAISVEIIATGLKGLFPVLGAAR
ncbi:MAG: NAAT family transporter [Nitrospinae bacterium]|nr:NAAT family transporter [Nitrospinota bacterium]